MLQNIEFWTNRQLWDRLIGTNKLIQWFRVNNQPVPQQYQHDRQDLIEEIRQRSPGCASL